MTDIGMALIGAGRVAENHFQAITRCEGATLRGIYEVDNQRAEQCSKKWNTKVYSRVEDIYQDPNVEAVFVLTPVEFHHKYTLEALEAGKHVLVEKPVGLTVAEIDDMISAAQKAGKVCAPGHSYLYLPNMPRTKQMIDEGHLGQICHMEMKEIYRMPEMYLERYHGVLGEVFCHPVYTLLYLLGKPDKVCGFKTCFRQQLKTGDEQVVVMAGYEQGPTATLMISWAMEDETSDPWTHKVKVLGTNGGTSFSRKDVVCGIIGNQPPWDYPMYDESFEREVDFFVNQCIKRGKPPLSTLEDARIGLQILEAIKKSIANNTVELIN